MKVFLTGATGFVGGQTLHALEAAGHEVRALYRGEPPRGARDPVRGDLDDVDAFAERLEGMDAVVHAAALLDSDDEEAIDRVNRRATLALARAAAARGVPEIVFVSSIAAVGIRSVGRVDADTPALPTTAYGRSKRDAELALLAQTSPKVVVVRPPTVYGPGERRNFLVFARAIARGRFVVPGRGENRMPFCHVRDVASAIARSVGRAPARAILHVSGPPLTLAAAADAIAGALGRRAPPRVPEVALRGLARAMDWVARPFGITPPLSPGRLRTMTSDFVLDTAPLEALGWRAEVAFEEGVRETVAWWRREGLL